MTPEIPETLWRQVVTGLVGTPFKWQGRGEGGYDCWGLLLEALRRLGMPLPPDYVTDTPECATRTILANLKPPQWVRQRVPVPGDVVMMSSRQVIHHTGLLTPYGILHTDRSLGAVVMPEAKLRAIGYQRIEYYRWVA